MSGIAWILVGVVALLATVWFAGKSRQSRNGQTASREPGASELEPPLSIALPPRDDATLQAVVVARQRDTSLSRAAASALEAPSMIAAIHRVLPSFELTFPLEEEGEPRLPTRQVEFLLWSYEDSGQLTGKASPNLPPPPDAIASLVATIAESEYRLSSWSAEAKKVAQDLDGRDLLQLLAVMVHPPSGAARFEAWDWFFRVQVAAALVVSHLGTEPWRESLGRRALEDVLDGPADWSNTAACVALLDVALRDEGARPLVVDALLRATTRSISPSVYQHAVCAAARALLEIPGLSPQTRADLAGILDPDL